jgi:adenine-specific DNA-methyltransferase
MNTIAVPIKYMGSKRSLALKIANRIAREHPKATVLDVFSGMCAVGTEVAVRHPLFTNDVHAFAHVVADALFVASDEALTSKEMSKFIAAFDSNKRALLQALRAPLKRERSIIEKLGNPKGWRLLKDFTLRQQCRSAPTQLSGLESLASYRLNPTQFPYSLASSYFGSSYFGISQAIEIDSLRYAIDQRPDTHRSRYLAALVQAVSHCATAPGHFAQFLVPRDRENTLYIGRIRQRSVLTRFLAALISFPNIDCFDRVKNRAYRSDATSLLKSNQDDFPRRNFVIYADPPYSKAQYSRYYHVLESLVLYDYPDCEGKGRYRSDRFHTNFSRRAGVVSAMTDFVEAAAKLRAPLYISYPRDGLLSDGGGNLRAILREHYKVVRLVAQEPLNHSTMGGASGKASIRALEEVYYATWR